MERLQEVRMVVQNVPPQNGVTQASHKGQLYLDSTTGKYYRARNQLTTDWDEVFFEVNAEGTSLIETDIPGIYEIR